MQTEDIPHVYKLLLREYLNCILKIESNRKRNPEVHSPCERADFHDSVAHKKIYLHLRVGEWLFAILILTLTCKYGSAFTTNVRKSMTVVTIHLKWSSSSTRKGFDSNFGVIYYL
jgi:hypothetical protein